MRSRVVPVGVTFRTRGPVRSIVQAAVAGVLGLIALLLSLFLSVRIGRSLIRDLRQLRVEAHEASGVRLPSVMRRLSAGEEVDVETEVPRLEYDKNEIGDVGQALNTLQRAAVEAAVKQAELRAGVSEVMNVIGDVRGMRCILVDDIVDSGGTLCNAADALLEAGALSVQAYVTHGVLSAGAVARVAASSMERLVITDSIRASEGVRVTGKVRVLSVAQLMGEAIRSLSKISMVSKPAAEMASSFSSRTPLMETVAMPVRIRRSAPRSAASSARRRGSDR